MILEPDKQGQGINWKEIRERLAAAEQALQGGGELSAEQARKVLDERARQLAETHSEPESGQVLEVITFGMSGERFALETRFVHKVTELGCITPLPGSPTFLLGVTNFHGDVTAVIDLGVFFVAAECPSKEEAQILVFGEERIEFGIRVDDIDQVMGLPIDDVLATPGSIQGPARDFLRGVTKDALLVLDGEVLLNDSRLYMEELE